MSRTNFPGSHRGSAAALCLAAVLAAAGSASAQTAPDASANAPPPAASADAPPTITPLSAQPVVADASFIVGVGDVIDVGVLGRPETNARARVAADGTVLLPMIGSVQVSGKTTAQLGAELAKSLERSGYFVRPLMKVEVVSIASRYITVLGFVGRPGLLPLDRDYHLSEIMARVGGKSGGGGDELVLTHSDGKAERYRVDSLATGIGGDPIIRNGDKIYIPSATESVAYLTGQVKGPGAFTIIPNMTIRMAIARGGGMTEMGSDKKIKIVRGTTTIPRAKLDDPIKPGDVIDIGERLF
jgi:polysaccharide export outer membrane protein